MVCPGCSHETPADARFCSRCGAPLGEHCPACGHPHLSGSRFCSACGGPLGAPPSRFGSPAAYTPGHLAARIRTSRASLEGERKQVTVLFADLADSMALLADRDPEEARQLLDPVLDLMMEAVHYYEGTVNQVLGDGIMALFGAPLAHEDHAVRACYAALRMQEAIARYAAELRAARGLTIQVRIGLNSGDVVVRSIGNDLTMDYSAVGESTHLAARMEQLASPGAILVTGFTARLTEGWVHLKPRAERTVKGLPRPVEIYELVGASPARSRVHAAAARGLTRFVGREAELAKLAGAREQAGGGRGQIVAVTGEAGVGKSRLLWEFLHGVRMARWLVLETTSLSYGRGMSYLPVIGLLKDALGGLAGADAAATRQRLRAVLGPGAPARLITPILALLDLAVEDPRWATLDPAERRRRTIEAVKHVVLALAREQPTCVVVEDLHWIDGETQAVLDSLVDALPAAPLLLLVTYRTEYEHGWGGKTYYTQLRVDALTGAGARGLVDVLLGAEASLDALKALLLERTEGNPFFLEECVRNLVESGALAGAVGDLRLARPVATLDVPPTVQSVLAARLDRLAPSDKQVLQAAAAIGKDVPPGLLRAVAGVEPRALEESLARLRASEFLYETRLLPEVEYTFKHALTLDVALGSLLRKQRRRLDAAIVAAIESADPGRRPEQLARVAHHALRGEVWDKALTYCREAGEHAAARSAHRAAVRYFEQALEALGHLPRDPKTLAEAIDMRLALRYSLSPLGEFARMIDELHEAERVAQELGDEVRLGRVCSFLANYHTVMLDFVKAIEYGRRALAIAERCRDVSLGVVASTFLALAHHTLAEYPAAIELARRNTVALTQGRELDRCGMALLPSVYSRVVLAWSLAETGEFDGAVAAGGEAVAIAERADHPYSVIFACLGLGTALNRRGEFGAALEPLERARELSQTAEVPGIFGIVAAAVASARAHLGRAEDAIELLKAAIDQSIAHGDPYGHWLRTGGLAEAYGHAGRAREALPLAERALDITRYVRARGQEAWAMHLLADTLMRQEPPELERAQVAYREALAVAETRGMRTLEARCRLGLADAAAKAGRLDDARVEGERAEALLAALGMTFWRRGPRATS